MNRDGLYSFFRETQEIAGWFSVHDAAVFDLLLTQQTVDGVRGDILEIGVFEGKSAVLLGRHLQETEELYVCDIFDDSSDVKNMEENKASYPQLTRQKFEENYFRFLGSLPSIYQCASSELPKRLGDKNFRFIHVDGSHLYQHVKGDLEYSYGALIGPEGIIALDDFRSQHTIGVTVAVWQEILAGKLVPLVLTPAKMYLGKPDLKLDFQRLQLGLESFGIRWVEEEILGRKALRTIGLQDADLYSRNHGIASFIPPIALDAIRKSYLWKKLRNR